jgi:sialic acid synthase SpsE
MIDAAFPAGADAIAFQVYRAAHLVVRRHPGRAALQEVELSPPEWRQVLGAAKATGLAVLVEALDPPSRDLAAEAEVDAFLVPAAELDHPDLLRALAEVGRPVFLSTGGAPEALLREALSEAGEPAALVHGPAAIPSAPEEIRFRDLAVLKERYQVSVGFADTTDGGSAFALVAPALAAAHGADFVLKRLTLDRLRRGRDYEAALSPEEFYRMVELLRQAERARGEGTEGRDVRPSIRGRSIVASTLIARGEVLTAEMLAFKRTDERFERGLSPREADLLIGRRAARPIQADETILEDMLE